MEVDRSAEQLIAIIPAHENHKFEYLCVNGDAAANTVILTLFNILAHVGPVYVIRKPMLFASVICCILVFVFVVLTLQSITLQLKSWQIKNCSLN